MLKKYSFFDFDMKTIWILLAFCIALSACAAPSLEDRVPVQENEVLYSNVLLNQVTGEDVVVFGVGLGDRDQAIIDLHGEANSVSQHNFGRIRNYEYDFTGDNQTDVLYHTEYGIVAGILLTSDANELLVNGTHINFTRADMYGLLGLPEVIEPAFRETIYIYDDIGIEVIISRGVADRIYFTSPNLHEGPGQEPDELCAQVITYAQDPATSECFEFSTPCGVPDSWTVVDSCE